MPLAATRTSYPSTVTQDSGRDRTDNRLLISSCIDIDAPAEIVWALLVDVEHWSEWSSGIANVTLAEPGPLRVGARAVVRRVRSAPSIWDLIALDPIDRMTWKTGMPGMWISASTSLEAIVASTRVTLAVQYQGVIGCLIGNRLKGAVKRSLETDAIALKERVESLAYRY